MVQAEEPFPDFYYLSLSPAIAEPAFDAPDEQQRVWGRAGRTCSPRWRRQATGL
jgi:hypothetical protein